MATFQPVVTRWLANVQAVTVLHKWGMVELLSVGPGLCRAVICVMLREEMLLVGDYLF